MKANPTKKQKVSISTAGTATAATDDDDDDDDGAWAGPDDNEPLVSALDEGTVQDEKYLLDKSRGQCDAYEKITTDIQPTQPSLATTTNNIIKTEHSDSSLILLTITTKMNKHNPKNEDP